MTSVQCAVHVAASVLSGVPLTAPLAGHARNAPDTRAHTHTHGFEMHNMPVCDSSSHCHWKVATERLEESQKKAYKRLFCEFVCLTAFWDSSGRLRRSCRIESLPTSPRSCRSPQFSPGLTRSLDTRGTRRLCTVSTSRMAAWHPTFVADTAAPRNTIFDYLPMSRKVLSESLLRSERGVVMAANSQAK